MLGLDSQFAGKRVLVTGGLGFIGSNLSLALVKLGARVMIVDSMIPGYGGNLFNIEPAAGDVEINFCDILDVNAINHIVRGQDFIFHLAGQVDHVLSLSDPFPDIDLNIKGTAVLMEACRRHNPGVRFVKAGTRGQYGPATSLPVREDAPTNPKGIYEISNLTAEKILQVYNDVHGIHTVPLRLTNVYGPRAQMVHSRYGVANWFVRLAIDKTPIKVFGDGSIRRDFLYVDDCVDALLLSAVTDRARGEVMNVGVDRPSTFLQLAKTLVEICPGACWEFAEFSPERKAQEPGDFYSDITKIRKLVGWSPQTELRDGLEKTVDYYTRFREHYW
ncbi:MAG TPA: NAD-dependent epimerase/dehydratase family protein [Candidatus Dormibacteraeota bacterium]|nr:NAD-dependent epimerase/dehydratase family protein [Candidatus Dormibacteraeota bacterium]